MENILYTQNESANQKNSIIVNGEFYSEMSTGIASDALRLINKKSGEKGKWVWLIEQLKDYGIIKSKNFKFAKDSSGILIKACFQEKDELGRNMTFLFYTKSTDINEACQILNNYAAKIKRDCFENELKILPYLSDKFIYGGILSSITLLILIIWKIAN
jgi:hypothetical protein